MPVFALGHYLPKGGGEDEFSKKINYFHLYGNDLGYFLGRFLEFYKNRIDGGITFDVVCVAPSHKEGKINSHMVELARAFADKIGAPYREVLRRNRTVKRQHELKTDPERMENVAGSLSADGDLEGKNVLVFDNVSISGATVREVHNILKEKKAGLCIFLCLGLGHLAKGTDFDINPNFKGKISRIIKEWHWPKVAKEKREAYKKSAPA